MQQRLDRAEARDLRDDVLDQAIPLVPADGEPVGEHDLVDQGLDLGAGVRLTVLAEQRIGCGNDPVQQEQPDGVEVRLATRTQSGRGRKRGGLRLGGCLDTRGQGARRSCRTLSGGSLLRFLYPLEEAHCHPV